MSLALGASISRRASGRPRRRRAFDDWMRAKPVDIGNTVRRNLLQFRKSGDPVAPYSNHDAGNGRGDARAPWRSPPSAKRKRWSVPRAAPRHTSRTTACCPMRLRMLVFMVQDALRGPTKITCCTSSTPPRRALSAFRFRAVHVSRTQRLCRRNAAAVFQSSSIPTIFTLPDRRGQSRRRCDTTVRLPGCWRARCMVLEGIPAGWLKGWMRTFAETCEEQAQALVC